MRAGSTVERPQNVRDTSGDSASVLWITGIDVGVNMLGGMKPFFQMPVYAESQDEYHEWLRSKVGPYGDSAVERGDSRERGESYARTLFGIPWPYNRVVGWIEIRVAHDVIKAYLTWTDQQRIRLDREEPFLMTSEEKIFECWMDDRLTSAEVFRIIGDELTAAAAERPIKGRWLDRTAFDSLGPHIDFPRFLGWSRAETV